MESPLERVGRGDVSAVADCIDRYGPAVYGLARRLLGDDHEAEDAMQEIFTELWRTADRYRSGRGEPETFVMTVARRRLIDRLRARGRRVALTGPVPGFEAVGSERAEDGAEYETVRRVLATLPQGQREALVLAVYAGYSHGDIAEELALPLGTVKSHIRRGLARVAQELGLVVAT